MICRINEIPEYISRLNLNKQIEGYTRNAHNTVVNELLTLYTPSGVKVFRGATVLGYKATVLNTFDKPQHLKNEITNTANAKIKELNKKYNNAVTLLTAIGKQYLAVNLTNFGLNEQLKKTNNIDNNGWDRNDPNYLYLTDDPNIRNTGLFFNLNSHTSNQIEDSVKHNLLVFCEKLGLDVKQAEIMVNNLKPNAVADIFRKTIRYAEGHDNKLPEEAAHFLLELMPKNHPVFQKAFNEIVNYPIYDRVKKEYEQTYNFDEAKIRKEAIAQLIAEEIGKIKEPINLVSDKTPLYKKPLIWLRDLFKSFKNLLDRNKEDAFTNLKWRLLNADISDLSFDNVKENVNSDGLYFSKTRFNELADEIENSKNKDKIIKELENTYSNLSKLKHQIDTAKTSEHVTAISPAKSKTIQFLKESISNLENTSLNVAITFSTMVLETNMLLKDFKNSLLAIDNIKDPNAQLLQWQNLMLSSKVLIDNIVPQIKKVDWYLSDSDLLKKEIGEILNNSASINLFINEKALELTSKIFSSTLADKVKELREKTDLKKQPLLANREQLIKSNGSLKTIQRIDRKLQDIEDEFLKLAPTEESIVKLLQGKLGDASSIAYLMQAAALNGNVLINELDNYIQQSLKNTTEQKNKVANLAQTAFDEFIKATGLSGNNIQKLYENTVEIVKVFDGYDKEGNPKYIFQKGLVSQHDKKYLAIAKKYSYDINALNREIYKEKDLNKINELKIQLRKLILDKKQWDLENMLLKYIDEYIITENLLDEDLGDGTTVNSRTQGIYTKLDIQNSMLNYATDETAINLIYDEIDNLNFELKEFQNTFNKQGIDLEVAKKLQQYKSKMSEMVDYILTEEGIANHTKYILELDKKFNSGEISEEVYNKLLERAYSETYSKEYWEEKQKLTEELKNKLELIAPHIFEQNENVKQDITDIYKKIEEIAKPLRDYNGIIDGSFDPNQNIKEYQEKVLQIKKYEEQIEDYKKSLIKLTGLSQNDLELVQKLRIDSYNSDNQEEKLKIKNQIDEIYVKARNNSIPTALKESINDTLNKLNSLTRSENTDYYNTVYADKLAEIDVEDFSKEKPYVYMGSVYNWNKELNKWVNNNNDIIDNTVIQADHSFLERETKLKTTDWFKNNHIWKNIFNEGSGKMEEIPVPIYIWRKSKPTDDKYIKKEPAFRFKTRKVKDEFLTKSDYLPKKGKFVNENYKKLSVAEKKFLTFMTDLYTSFQDEILPKGKRPGLMLPTITKTAWDKMQDFNQEKLKQAVKNVGESAKRLVVPTSQDVDYLYGEKNHDIFGDLPILFTSKLDAELQSSDALKSILVFIGHLIDYKQLKETKPLADALLLTVSNPENAPVKNPELFQKMLKTVKLFNSNPEEEKIKGTSVMQKHIESMMNRFYYNKHQEEEVYGGVNFGKIVNNSLGFASVGILGGKPFAALKNSFAGKMQIFLTSQLLKEKIYTPTALANAQSKTPKILIDLTSDYLKAGNHTFYHQLLNKFDAFQGHFTNEFGQRITATSLKEGLNFTNIMMIPKNMVEIEQQVINAYAVLRTIQVKNKDSFVPLSEAFTLKGGVITPKFEIPQKTIEEAINKIKYANIVTNGNFNKMDAIVAQQYGLGRMLLFMNKWIAPMLHYRWGETTYNASINEITTGYQRLFMRRIMEDIFKDRIIPLSNMSNYTEDEKRAVWTNAYEMGIILSLSLCFATLGGNDPDKYKKLKQDPNSYWKAQLMSMILSVNQENQNIHPIFGIDNIAQKVKSPFPAARLYENVTKFLFDLKLWDESVYYKKDTGLYKEGDWKGLAAIYKLTGIEGLKLTLNSEEQLKRTEQSQFIK